MSQCPYCKKLFKKLTEEHLIPRSKHGCNHKHNILMVCKDCNDKRGNMPMYQWLQIKGKDQLIKDVVARKLIKTIDCYMKKHYETAKTEYYLRERNEYLEQELRKKNG